MMNEYLKGLIGGVLIGGAAILLLLADGKIAGISGMVGGLFRARARWEGWRIAFLSGLLAGGALAPLAGWTVFVPLSGQTVGTLLAAGLLVGFGTQIGSGCTSGHGVCGIGRFSLRSLIATVTFIITGALTVVAARYFLGTVV